MYKRQEPLYEQLAVGGRMVVPVGKKFQQQSLLLITRTASGFEEESLADVKFVPFLSGKS